MPVDGVGATRSHTYRISYDLGCRKKYLRMEMESFIMGSVNRLSYWLHHFALKPQT